MIPLIVGAVAIAIAVGCVGFVYRDFLVFMAREARRYWDEY